jgi:2,3-bisphosphoglycerate-dependent phosphoglycerate mutase
MPEVLLVRHAAAQGQNADAPLTSEGRRQASILAGVLLPFRIQRVICSPYLRAIQTAEPLCERAGLRIETDSRLVERVLSARNMPDWRELLRRSFDDLDYRLEDGESARTAQDRGAEVVRGALGVPERCAVVTHGHLIALILKWVDATVGYDAWSQLSNPDAFVVHFEGSQRGRFRRVWQPSGLTSHLSGPA